MGQGLGKNSSVVLSLGKENYEALISRHGQWMRWRVARRCHCVKCEGGQPDIHCRLCGGLGIVYTAQKELVISQTVLVKDTTGIIEIGSSYEGCVLQQVYDNSGAIYDDVEKAGSFLIFQGRKAAKGAYITAIMKENVVKKMREARCVYQGGHFWRAEGLTVSKPSIEGLYYTAPSDIQHIGYIRDDDGKEYKASEFREDMFYIDWDDAGDIKASDAHLIACDIEYIEPFLFVLLSQNLQRSDERALEQAGGDAVLTFPYSCDVSQDDVITVLSGTYTKKSVMVRKNAIYDVIGSYFVSSIEYCAGIREYKAGFDFMLSGTNYIKWVCDDAPRAGDTYSITYHVLPTYKVVQSIPQIRTSENQRMPKKCVVKLYDTYGDVRGVNRQ